MDWAEVEKDLSGRGVTLKLLWEEWRKTHPDGMSYVTWTRRFRDWRPCVDVTMRQNRRPGERLFVDYAGMTVPLFLDGVEHDAQVFVASMGVSGRVYCEATLSQKIDDWCSSHVRCFDDMGWAPQVAVPDNVKAAVKTPSRYEPGPERDLRRPARALRRSGLADAGQEAPRQGTGRKWSPPGRAPGPGAVAQPCLP